MTVIPSNAPAVRYYPAPDARPGADASHQVDIIRQQRF